MAQAATASTDELLSQLAASEIDRLLAEADGNPAPIEPKPQNPAPAADSNPQSVTDGNERAALLQAAGFDPVEPAAPVAPAPAPHSAPVEDERAALLQAAGFESPAALSLHDENPLDLLSEKEPGPLPIFLKPLEWINAPLEYSPDIVRQVMGKVGIVTLINALAVLTYVFFFRKH